MIVLKRLCIVPVAEAVRGLFVLLFNDLDVFLET